MTTLKKKLKKLLQEVITSSKIPNIIKEDARNDLDYLEHDEFTKCNLEDMIDFYIYLIEKETNQRI